MKLKFVILLLPYICSVCTMTGAMYCTDTAGATPSPSDPPLPSLPDSYEVSVECNIIDKGYTIDSKIYFDFPGNRALLKFLSNGLEGKTLYNYETDELFTMTDNSCTVEKLTGSKLDFLFGETINNGKPHIQPSAIAFKFGQSYGEKYMGNTTVRGISVNHWQSCSYSNQTNTDVKVDYYFSTNWNVASLYYSAPVRAEIQGTQLLANGTLYNIHHVYEFHSYLPYLEADPSVFETDPGVVCPGQKHGRPVPTLPAHRFAYRTESIYEDLQLVTYTDTWYEKDYRQYRTDYKPIAKGPPTYTMNPITEIHDYNTGVMYVIDKTLGNCTILPLANGTDDGQIVNGSATAGAGGGAGNSFYYSLRNPANLLHVDGSYTYVGKLTVRGIQCDVFKTKKSGWAGADFVGDGNVTITVYFLSDGWTDNVNTGKAQNIFATPVKMILFAEEIGLTLTINYFDFDSDTINLDVFDVSSCYPDTEKMKFTVQFPGTFQVTTKPALLTWSHVIFAQTMSVSPLRLQDLQLNYDDAAIYISATLLDRTQATAQFSYLPGKELTHQDDSVINDVEFPTQCAGYCIYTKDFVCNSFDFCQSARTCRLSKYHGSDGGVVNMNSTCDHFFRNVKGPPIPEPTVTEAFSKLQKSVYDHVLQLDQNLNMIYTAVDVVIDFGWETNQVTIPKLNDQFSYKIEATLPFFNHSYNSQIWYDESFRLVRYDIHTNSPTYPYYSADPLTVIHDFNTGLQYLINNVYSNCTVSPIPNESYDSKMQSKISYDMVMRDPLHFLRIDKSYRFVGQRTVRGMTCNVFESEQSGFVLPNTNRTTHAVFKYFFLADGWSEVTDSFGGSALQPVQLQITSLESNLFLEYSLFDFNVFHPPLSVFDVHVCYPPTQQHHFQVSFPGNFMKYLTTNSNLFVTEALFEMANKSDVALLRLQFPQLTYDKNNIYLTSTLLGYVNVKTYFKPEPLGVGIKTASRNLDGLTSEEECAAMCLLETNFTCNGFFFCETDRQCVLIKNHIAVSNLTTPESPSCVPYTRTVDGPVKVATSNLQAYNSLKNAVYSGQLKLAVPDTQTDQTKLFIASGIRDDLVQPEPDTRKTVNLQHYSIYTNDASVAEATALFADMAVDDCASSCSEEDYFNCHGFVYCYDSYTCALLDTQPDQIKTEKIYVQKSCVLFARTYLDDYTLSPGIFIPSPGDLTLPSVMSAGDCAKSCSRETKIDCRSFEYCQGNKKCLLFEQRRVNTPLTNNQTDGCQQYISTSFRDFQLVSHQSIKFSAPAIQVIDISVHECSELCMTELGSSCTAFYFCGNSSTCFLTGSLPGSSGVQLSDNGKYCGLYNREYYPPSDVKPSGSASPSSVTMTTKTSTPSTTATRNPTVNIKTTNKPTASPPTEPSQATPVPPSHSPPKTSSTVPNNFSQPQPEILYQYKIDSGSMAGLSFAMLLVGMVIGVVSLHFYRRWREMHPSGMTSNLITQNDRHNDL